MPREIRDQIYKYLLPGEEMALTNLFFTLSDGMQSFMTLRAVNQQIRAEVIDTFNSTVPVSFEPSCNLELWGLPVEGNERLELRRRSKRIITGKEDALLPWDVSKAKNFIVFDSSPQYHGTLQGGVSKSYSYTRLISLLKTVERIAKLELRLYIHAGRDVYCPRVNRVAAMDKVQAVIQEIGGLFKSEFAGKAKDVKLTVGVYKGWGLSQDEKEILDHFEDYRKEWERDMIHPSD
jgi:hypothetical protein